MKCSRNNAALVAIASLALVLRLLRLDWQSVWVDETFSMAVCTQPLGTMMRRLVSDYVHPPLHYLLLRTWMDLTGFAPFQARLLSVVFGVLAVLAIHKLASYLFDQRTGLVAALLLAISQLGVMYSQEARPYEQLLFLTLVAMWLFALALFEHRAGAWCAFVAAAVLTIYTNYCGMLLLFALAVFAFIWRRQYPIRPSWWISGGAITALLYAPWLVSGVIPAALHSQKVTQAVQMMPIRWTSFFAAVNWFNNGKYYGLRDPSPAWTFVAGGVLLSLPVLLSIRPLGRLGETSQERPRLWLLVLTFLVSLGLILALGIFRIQYDVRYVAFCAGPYYVMAARGLATLRDRRMRLLWLAAILAYSAGSLHANYFIPYKENYRGALGYLASEYREGDCVLFVPSADPPSVPWEWKIYYHDRIPLRIGALQAVASCEVHCARVWLVRDTFRLSFSETKRKHEASRLMLSTLFNKTEERQYLGMEVLLYEPKK
jgi:4-amino-4-deoxy-L-arabinose transferase-like glycosyltransferase